MTLKRPIRSLAYYRSQVSREIKMWDRKLFKRLIKNSSIGNHIRIFGSDGKRLIQILSFLSVSVSVPISLDPHVGGDPLVCNKVN